MTKYLFKSERLGFRNWKKEDIPSMTLINAEPKVMEFFPSTLSKAQTIQFIERMKTQFSENGFCYFAVEKLENNEFIGFIGIAKQNYKSDFTPCVDIGWRLSQNAWGKGYATEGAKRCLDFAFANGLKTIKSICPVINKRSESVMKKLGMKKIAIFNHPLLSEFKDIESCVVYEIKKEM